MKKVLSCLMSISVLASTATALAASSAFNPNKDPNGDVSLTIADSAFIIQYLAGKYEVSDLTQLDVDDNNVASDVDEVYVRMYDAGMLSSTEQTAEVTNVSSTSTSRRYNVYNSLSGAYLRNYSLSVTDMDNSVATTAMFPPNDQVEDWSNIGVAKIMSDEAEYGYLGTGFVVGPHTIATAAHVVYERTTNSTYHINEILLFDENGNEESFTPVEIHTPYNYITNNDVSDFDFDYSLITVEENLNDYMSFNLGLLLIML